MIENLDIPVLVIDDDESMLETIQRALDNGRIKNYHLFDNEDDFDDAITDDTHIAIIDHYLGGLHVGFDVMDKFEKKRKTKIPSSIIIISGQGSENIMMRYINEKRVHAYIKKPSPEISVEEFQNSLVRYTKTAIEKTLDYMNYFESYGRTKKSLHGS